MRNSQRQDCLSCRGCCAAAQVGEGSIPPILLVTGNIAPGSQPRACPPLSLEANAAFSFSDALYRSDLL